MLVSAVIFPSHIEDRPAAIASRRSVLLLHHPQPTDGIAASPWPAPPWTPTGCRVR